MQTEGIKMEIKDVFSLKIRDIFSLIISLPITIYVNFRCLPFKTALKFPIFVGYKTYQNQKTQWPRNGSTEVPDDIKAAQIYETIELGFGDNSANDAIEKGIKGESIGKISTEY